MGTMPRALISVLVLALAGCSGELGDAPAGDDAGAIDDVSAIGDAPGLDDGTHDGGLDAATDADAASDTSPDAPPTDAKPAGATLRIAVLSDLNGSYGSTTYESSVHAAVAALVDGVKPDLVLVTGDMVAGQQAGLDYAAMWKGFHAAVTTPLTTAGIPVAITPGNHDASAYSAFAAERAEFVKQWSSPERTPKVAFVDESNWPLRYSFAYKGAFFVSIDATTVAKLSAEQRAWVDAQLAGAAAYKVKIAYAHLPIHPFAIGRETEVTNDLELEKIFATRGLTMFVSGHHHAYYPGAAGGVRQIGTSCAGAGPRRLIGTSTTSPKSVLRIDVEDDVVTSVEALAAPSFTTPIARSSLPTKLTYGSHTLTRDDLAGF